MMIWSYTNHSNLDEDLSAIKSYSLDRISFYSDNDPYIPKIEAEKFANNILVKKILVNNVGHFNEKFNYTEFSDLLKFI